MDKPSQDKRSQDKPSQAAREELVSRRIDQALGRKPCDLLVRGVEVFDLVTGRRERSEIAICGETIVGLGEGYRGAREIDASGLIAVPGFIDAHLHVESSLVTPRRFQQCVVPCGTTTAICDPHEMANVLGSQAIAWFLKEAEALALDLRVQLSSCVPASALETSGARLTVEDLLPFAEHPKVLGLAEMMNFPGLLAKEPDVLAKLAAFQDRQIDGHAPLVSGRDLNAYVAAGVRNDHESSRLEEGREKLARGLFLLIREGSVAKNLDTLLPLLDVTTSPFIGFCTDDRNPLEIAEEGHIDFMVRRAIAKGVAPLAAYRAASWSSARAFGLRDRGLVAPGQRADLLLLSDLEGCAIERVILGGAPAEERLGADDTVAAQAEIGRDSIRLQPVQADSFRVSEGPPLPSIGIVPGSIVTERLEVAPEVVEGERRAAPSRDLLKLAVLDRHSGSGRIGRGFVRGFGFTRGALASSVGHDAHNVIVVGCSDTAMARAVNRLIALQGGFVVDDGERVAAELPLPIAGLMSDRPAEAVREDLEALRRASDALGCRLADPFLQLAFLPLSVIPALKLTDRGLIDVERFELLG